MKRFIILGSAFLLLSCSTASEPEKQAPRTQTSVVPCSYSCVGNSAAPCGYTTVQQVQKPRVTEVMPKKRPCCDDDNRNAKEVIPDSPEIYVIAANRTLRSMLSENRLPIKSGARIYVAETTNNEPDMPTGYEKGVASLKRGLSNAGFVLADDRGMADYVITNEIAWFDTATKTVPAIKYSLGLYNPRGQKLGEWSEILHQVKGDRSWW